MVPRDPVDAGPLLPARPDLTVNYSITDASRNTKILGMALFYVRVASPLTASVIIMITRSISHKMVPIMWDSRFVICKRLEENDI